MQGKLLYSWYLYIGYKFQFRSKKALVNDVWPRDPVLLEAITPDIDLDTGIRRAVGARALDARRELATAARRHPDLLFATC